MGLGNEETLGVNFYRPQNKESIQQPNALRLSFVPKTLGFDDPFCEPPARSTKVVPASEITVTESSQADSPLKAIVNSPGQTQLQRSSGISGISVNGHLFSVLTSQIPKKTPVEFKKKDACKNQPVTKESTKQVGPAKVLTGVAKKRRKPIRLAREKKTLSASAYARGFGAGTNHKFEWLHLHAHSLGGEETSGNIVAGTRGCNQYMSIFESAISQHLMDHPDREMTLTVTANLLPSNSDYTHIATAITYTLKTESNELAIKFNPLCREAPSTELSAFLKELTGKLEQISQPHTPRRALF